MAEIVAGNCGQFSQVGPGPLTRVPMRYDPDQPHGDPLKRRPPGLGLPLRDRWRKGGEDFVAALTAGVERLMPCRTFLVERL